MKFDKLPPKDTQTFAKFVCEAEESSDTKRRQITQMFLTLNHGAQEMDDRMNFIAALLTEAANEEGKTYRNLQDLPLRRWPRVLQALDQYQTRFMELQARIAEDTAHDERMKLSALDGSKLAVARIRAAGMTSTDMTTMLIRFRNNAHGNGGDRIHRRNFLDNLYERLGYTRFKNVPSKLWGDIILALEEYEVDMLSKKYLRKDDIAPETIRQAYQDHDAVMIPITRITSLDGFVKPLPLGVKLESYDRIKLEAPWDLPSYYPNRNLPNEETPMTADNSPSRDPHTLDTLAQTYGRIYGACTAKLKQAFDDLDEQTQQIGKEAAQDGLPKHLVDAIHNAAAGATMSEGLKSVLAKKSASNG